MGWEVLRAREHSGLGSNAGWGSCGSGSTWEEVRRGCCPGGGLRCNTHRSGIGWAHGSQCPPLVNLVSDILHLLLGSAPLPLAQLWGTSVPTSSGGLLHSVVPPRVSAFLKERVLYFVLFKNKYNTCESIYICFYIILLFFLKHLLDSTCHDAHPLCGGQARPRLASRISVWSPSSRHKVILHVRD